MRLLPIAAAAGLAVSVAYVGSARADEDTQPSGPLHGPYVAVGVGRFNLKPENINDFGTGYSNIAHSKGDAVKIGAGYRFMPYFALEANYIDFGNPNSTFS